MTTRTWDETNAAIDEALNHNINTYSAARQVTAQLISRRNPGFGISSSDVTHTLHGEFAVWEANGRPGGFLAYLRQEVYSS